MLKSKMSGLAVSLLVFLPAAMTGQKAQENVVPLKNWAAPLYWRPNQAERENATKSGAQIQFSSNATSNTALIFVAVSPCRLVDTRGAAAGFMGSIPFNGPYIPAGGTATFPVQSNTQTQTTAPSPCGVIPTAAQAYSVNLTLVPHPLGTSVNFVTMWPDNGSAIPSVSTLDDQQGAIVANSAIVPAGTNSGGIKVFAYGATDVIIDMNGFYAAPTDLSSNTAIGLGALAATPLDGGDNTAIGYNALNANTGNTNTAIGYEAMLNNTSGGSNTAIGYQALQSNLLGTLNTAVGYDALTQNNSTYNTALGSYALNLNTSGSGNTAVGNEAMVNGTTGSFNTAVGQNALQGTTGVRNTAIGQLALYQTITGTDNIGIGQGAGGGLSNTGSNNILIGNAGVNTDSNVIRLGGASHAKIFLAAVSGVTTDLTGAVPVVVASNGQLGTVSSSARFKEDIKDMGEASSRLLQLRPVTFRYKQSYADGSKPIDYGLIAEEVATVYPDLVAKDADGQIQTVQYQKLTPMLLNEVQKQSGQLQKQQEENRKLEERDRQQEGQIQSLEERLAALEALLSSQAPTPAQSTSIQ